MPPLQGDLAAFSLLSSKQDEEVTRCGATLLANLTQQETVRPVFIDRLLPTMFNLLDPGQSAVFMLLLTGYADQETLIAKETRRQIAKAVATMASTHARKIMCQANSHKFVPQYSILRSLILSDTSTRCCDTSSVLTLVWLLPSELAWLRSRP